MLKLGFDVPKWENKALSEFTNEELLEYYYKLRLICKPGSLNTKSSDTEFYAEMLQQEIISRMEKGCAI